jgi:hypothetical protein
VQVSLDIEKRTPLFNRHTCLRVRNWIDRLSKSSQNATWKRCRNEYAGLLLFQLSKGHLEAPFDCEPPSGPLMNLPLHLRVDFQASRRAKSLSVPRTGGARTSKKQPVAATATQCAPDIYWPKKAKLCARWLCSSWCQACLCSFGIHTPPLVACVSRLRVSVRASWLVAAACLHRQHAALGATHRPLTTRAETSPAH